MESLQHVPGQARLADLSMALAFLCSLAVHNPWFCHTHSDNVWSLQAGTIFVMTHDSIGLGEDGPTHQPVEHLASFRAMPNILMMRPGDGNETAGCYKVTAIFLHHLGSCSHCHPPCSGIWRSQQHHCLCQGYSRKDPRIPSLTC